MNSIEFKNVSYAYPNGFLANKNLNLKIFSGERVAIIGQNGAGKTTAAKLMNGLNQPTNGDVIVNGINTKTKTTAQIARHVGYVFQNPDEQIFNNTVLKEIEYMPKYLKLDEKEINRRVNNAINITCLDKYKNMNPFDISYSIRKFVTIAAVIATNPQYIILDEPTAGQDYSRINILKNILDYLQSIGVGVIVITHDMDFVVDAFKRVVVMANKHIIADTTPKDIFNNASIIEKSCINRPQIGEIANLLDLKDNIITRNDMVKFLKTCKLK